PLLVRLVATRGGPSRRLAGERERERTTRPYRPPALTHVNKRGGCPPSAFRLLPCGEPPGACSPAPNRVGLPILRCWIKIERPAPALQERSRAMILQKGGRGVCVSGHVRLCYTNAL